MTVLVDDRARLRRVATADLTASEIEAIRTLLGALGTGRYRFYERLGWLRWAGPSFVRTAGGLRPTPDEDGYILVLPTPSSPPLDQSAGISCDWRPGDVW